MDVTTIGAVGVIVFWGGARRLVARAHVRAVSVEGHARHGRDAQGLAQDFDGRGPACGCGSLA
jgi:hypothetical protein